MARWSLGRTLTVSQQRLLDAVDCWDGSETFDVYQTYAGHYPSMPFPLAWHNADRAARALARYGLVRLDDGRISLTERARILIGE